MLPGSTNDSHSKSQEQAAPPPHTKQQLPDQRRRCMSDKFMMFTYKIKMCKRQDPHNWRLCPYAHPGEAGKRRPPHAYQAVMCDFSRTKKECSHGEACLLARNALEYWLHPAKYRTILCGHGEACNRNICFFAHNQQELRTPATRPGGDMEGEPDAADAAAAAADAFAQFSIAGRPGAGSSQAAAAVGGPQFVYVATDPAASAAMSFAACEPVAGSSLVQPMQAMRAVGPQLGPDSSMQQQLLVSVHAPAAPSEHQQQPQAGMVPAAAIGSGMPVHTYHPARGQGALPGMVVAGQRGLQQLLPPYVTGQQVQSGQRLMHVYSCAQPQLQLGQQQAVQHGHHSQQQLQQVAVVSVGMPAGVVDSRAVDSSRAAGGPVMSPAAASPQAAALQQQQPVPMQPLPWAEQAQLPGAIAAPEGMLPYYAVPMVSVPAGHMAVGTGMLQPGQYMQPAGLVNLQQQQQQQYYDPQQQLQQPLYFHQQQQQQQQQPQVVLLSPSGGSGGGSNPGQMLVGISASAPGAAPAQLL